MREQQWHLSGKPGPAGVSQAESARAGEGPLGQVVMRGDQSLSFPRFRSLTPHRAFRMFWKSGEFRCVQAELVGHFWRWLGHFLKSALLLFWNPAAVLKPPCA